MWHESVAVRWKPVLASFLIAFGCSVAAANNVAAQGNTEIFLIRLGNAGGRLSAHEVTRVTNRPGYDNQPHILPENRVLLYTTVDSAGRADIFRYDIESRSAVSLTRTERESEYSATLMPGGERFSVIRVERDSTQRLWSFRLDGRDAQVLLKDVRPVGYHAWIDPDRVALFVLGNPSTLQLGDLRTGQARVIAQNIGRSLNRIPGRTAVSFVHREGEGSTGWIKSYDPDTGEINPIIQAPAENEYHAWTPSRSLITARGSVVYQFIPGRDSTWVQVADLSSHGITRISRLSVSPDGTLLALVTDM